MYTHMQHDLIHALEEERREAAARSVWLRPARAAPVPGRLRLAVGRFLVRAGNRLAPGTTPASNPAVPGSCC
jgi:hypothetical protein